MQVVARPLFEHLYNMEWECHTFMCLLDCYTFLLAKLIKKRKNSCTLFIYSLFFIIFATK